MDLLRSISFLSMARRLISNQSGMTAVEYGLIAAGIALTITPVVYQMGTNTRTTFNQVDVGLSNPGAVLTEGTEGDDILVGIPNRKNVMNGYGGNDSITGANLADNLNGGTGNDVLNGEDGNDNLNGGEGADVLNGGSGEDTADYTDSNAAVNIDLGAGTASGGHAQGDTLSGIENVSGSTFNDILRGDANNNTLNGGAGADQLYGMDGNDTLIGGSGADTLDGGNGYDTASYLTATSGVTIVVGGGGSTGDAVGDTYASIERIRGSLYNDTINVVDNSIRDIEPGNGDDTIYGNNFVDINYYINLGDGNDTIYHYSGADHIYFGAGITLDSLSVTVSGNDLVLNYAGGGSLKMYNGSADSAYLLETLHLHDGSTVNINSLPILAHATEGDDTFNGGYAIGRTFIMDYSTPGGDDVMTIYGGTEQIRFGAGIAAEDLNVTSSGSNLVLDYGTGTLTMNGAFFDRTYSPETIRLSNGTTINFGDITVQSVSTAGDDTFNSGYAIGLTYTYDYTQNGGNDTIMSYGGTETINFGTGVDANDITITSTGSNLTIHHPNGTINLPTAFTDNTYQINDFRFDGGAVQSFGSYPITAIASTGDDNFNGGYSVGRVISYDMTQGGGNDTISAYGATAQIQFGPGISSGDLSYSTVGNDRIVTYPGGQITITNGILGGAYQVQNIRLDNGTIIPIPY